MQKKSTVAGINNEDYKKSVHLLPPWLGCSLLDTLILAKILDILIPLCNGDLERRKISTVNLAPATSLNFVCHNSHNLQCKT